MQTSSHLSTKLWSRALFDLEPRADRLTAKAAKMYLRSLGVGSTSVFSYTQPVELIRLLKLSMCCPSGSRILEVGSHLGASALFMGGGIKKVGGKLYCVDTWENQTMPDGQRDTFPEFSRNTAGLQDVIVPLRGRSTEISHSKIDGPLSLIFIDGDHSYLGVSTDFEHYRPLLSEDGVIAFHDATSFAGVSKFTGELLASGRWQMVSLDQSLLVLKPAAFVL